MGAASARFGNCGGTIGASRIGLSSRLEFSLGGFDECQYQQHDVSG
jgi:hypothetical protein